MARKIAIVAVGGNALIRDPKKTGLQDQFESVRFTVPYIVDLIQAGYSVAITHGNGPQVGFLLRKNEISAKEVPPAPLDYIGSNTQGSIGYMFETSLYNEFRRRGMPNRAVALVTETVVDANDPAFKNPTKPIGSFMDEATAKMRQEQDGWSVVEDSGRGWRRVVPSPRPKRIIQESIIRELLEQGETVIAVGGGGVPVAEAEDGTISGLEAVIDKDLASSVLASSIGADLFIISTEVEKVALDFTKPTRRWLDKLTIAEAEQYLKEGQFGKGSMEPKVKAVIDYLKNGGKEAIITNSENIIRSLRGESGTRFVL
ncbi:carbamate kinase [Gracilinema caldarium]|uniref:carbamate kinase n=1 Tax=Gracilinema caldarium TaxID=215591 RepID=UPI0026F2CFCA|nr:carbamate kinase [Gracilinema caldarium]